MSVSKILSIAALLITVSFSQLTLSQENEKQRIYELIADYGWYADSRDMKSYLGLFTADGAFVAPEMGLSLNSPKEMSDFLGPRWQNIAESGEQRRHIITGIRVTSITEKSATYRAILNLTANPSDGETKEKLKDVIKHDGTAI
jgi:hypothetical protein